MPFVRNNSWVLQNIKNGDCKILGKGAYGKVYLTKYPGREGLVVAKVNHCRSKDVITFHEAAILAYLNGRGGAPKLISTHFR